MGAQGPSVREEVHRASPLSPADIAGGWYAPSPPRPAWVLSGATAWRRRQTGPEQGQALSSHPVLWPGVGRGDGGPAGWGAWRDKEALTGKRWVAHKKGHGVGMTCTGLWRKGSQVTVGDAGFSSCRTSGVLGAGGAKEPLGEGSALILLSRES